MRVFRKKIVAPLTNEGYRIQLAIEYDRKGNDYVRANFSYVKETKLRLELDLSVTQAFQLLNALKKELEI